jgi:uncharacterized membrane protein required for colicin V production
LGNSIDIICALVMLYGFYHGYTRGIIGTVITLTGYLLGVVLSFKAIPFTGNILEELTGKHNPMMAVAAFVLNLVIVMLVLRIISNGLEGVLSFLFLGIVNRILGGLVMSLIAALIFSVLLWFGAKARLVNESALAQSVLYEPFLSKLPGRARGAIVWLRPFVSEAWGESMNWMNRLENFDQPTDPTQPRIYELPDDGRDIDEDPDDGSSSRRRSSASRDDGIEE